MIFFIYQKKDRKNSGHFSVKTPLSLEKKDEEEKTTSKNHLDDNFITLKGIFVVIFAFSVGGSVLYSYYGFESDNFYRYSLGFSAMSVMLFFVKDYTSFQINRLEDLKKKSKFLSILKRVFLMGQVLGVFLILWKMIELSRLLINSTMLREIDFVYYLHVIWFSIPFLFLGNYSKKNGKNNE